MGSEEVTDRGPHTRGARPVNRKALITTAAAELFYRHGYPRVTVNEIATAVGIGPSALYRHFASKQQVLARVVVDQLGMYRDVLSRVDEDDPEVVLGKLAEVAAQTRQLGVLWQRDSRHLPDEQRDELAEQLKEVASALSYFMRCDGRDLSDEDVRFRSWSVFSALTSPSYHQVELPETTLTKLLVGMVRAIGELAPMALDRSRAAGTGENDGSAVASRASRRRLLLSAATRLFSEHGYSSVTIEDIGASVGIVGASVYNHFSSKQDLLNTSITRASAWLEIELERLLAVSAGPREALRALLLSYATFVFEHRGFIDLIVGEVDHLPDAERHRARQIQGEYVSEWVALLGEARSDLDTAGARILVQAALTTANDMARTGNTRDVDAITRIGEALMFETASPRA